MSNVIVTSGGTLPLEAMIIGLVSIIYTPKNKISHNPLRKYPNSALFVNDVESMYEALRILQRKEYMHRVNSYWEVPCICNNINIHFDVHLFLRFVNLPF